MRNGIPIVVLLLALIAEPAQAQQVRPVEIPTVRPILPVPVPVVPLPNLPTQTPLQPAPAINSPSVVVPAQPAVPIQTFKPRKCWCYARSPASATSVRTTCQIECCKGNKQDERC